MIEMRIAQTAHDQLACFKLRKEVFVDKYHYLESNKPMMFDVYDTLPNNYNLLAYQNNTLIGSVRITLGENTSCTSVNEYFDFSSIINGNSYAAGSMLCSTLNDASYHLGEWLVLYAYLLCHSKDVDYILACVNPVAESLFKKCGFQTASNTFTHPHFSQPILPLYIHRQDYLKALNSTAYLPTDDLNRNRFLVLPEDELGRIDNVHETVPMQLNRKFRDQRKENKEIPLERRKISLYQEGQIIYDNFGVAIKTT